MGELHVERKRTFEHRYVVGPTFANKTTGVTAHDRATRYVTSNLVNCCTN